MAIIFLSLLFLVLFPLQPWDPVLGLPSSLPIPPFLIFVFLVVVPPAATPPVVLYTIHGMMRSPDLLANPPSDAGPTPASTTCTQVLSRWREIRSLMGAAAAQLVRLGRKTRRPQTLPLKAARVTDMIALPRTNRRLLLSEEMYAAFLGGWFQVAFQFLNQNEEFKPRLRQASFAILLATVMAALWHRLWREHFSSAQILPATAETEDNLFLFVPAAGLLATAKPPPQISSSFSSSSSIQLQHQWKRLKKWGVLSVLSGGWVWVTVFIIASPTDRPAVQFRLMVATTIQASLLLGNILLDSPSTILNRLWHRPQVSAILNKLRRWHQVLQGNHDD